MIPKTMCIFSAHGDAPATVSDIELEVLRENAFQAQSIGVPQQIEVGFVAGEHIYDTDFTYAKNGFGPLLLFVLRIDTHNVPSNIKQAYKRMHEKAVAANKENHLGFLSRQEKREATELTNRQIAEELAAGKYRKSNMIPILWDLQAKQLIFGSASVNAIDQLHKIMRDVFNVELDQLTSGGIARQILSYKGNHFDFEDIRPTGYTPAPAAALDTAELTDVLEIPFVPWATASVDMKDFLGNEFLMWLWWTHEDGDGEIQIGSDRYAKDTISMMFDRSLQMECAWGVGGKQTLTGDGPTRLKEASEALASGKWPRKAGLLISDNVDQWEFTLQADMMIAGSVKLPSTSEAQSPREVVEHQITATRRLCTVLRGMYETFVSVRFDEEAWKDTSQSMSAWIDRRHELISQTATA